MQAFNLLAGFANGMASPPVVRYAAAIVILFAGLVASRLLGLLTRRVLNAVKLNTVIEKTLKKRLALEEIIPVLVSYGLYFASLVVAISFSGLFTKALYIVLIAISIVVFISIITALKDFFPNLVAGLYLLHLEHLKPGDRVELENVKGKVTEIHLLDSRIESDDKNIIFVPNSTMLKGVLKVKKAKAPRAKS